MMGPHKRAGRRRRRGKALVIFAALLLMMLATSWTAVTVQTGRTDMSASELAHLCNLATYSPGTADDILGQYPELTTGEMEILLGLERDMPGFTVALRERYQAYDMQIGGG